MDAFLFLIYSVVDIYIWVIIIAVIFSWLLAFNLLNINSSFIQSLHSALRQLTEPVFASARRFLPNLGGFDIAPVVVILLLVFVQRLLVGAL